MIVKDQKSTARSLEHEGFYQGAHGTNSKHVLDEIRALFARRRAETEKASVERLLPCATIRDQNPIYDRGDR